MERVHVALVQMFLLTIVITSGEATKCYQCTSLTPSCNDPFDKTAIEPTECTASSVDNVIKFATGLLDDVSGGITGKKAVPEVQWSCLKTEYKPTSGDSMLVRTCSGAKSTGLDPCVLKNKDDKQTFCGVCEGDGCNSAVRLGGFSVLFYLLVPCLVALKAVAA